MSLAQFFAPVNTPVFTMLGASMSWSEIFGFIFGAWCVWLVAKQSIWNWPIGLANNVFFLLLFISSGLYADSGLQVFYILLAVYGWWAWLRGGESHKQLTVSRTPRQTALMLCGAGVLGTGVLFYVLSHYTNSTVPFADAVTTALSLAATYGQCRKQIASWWLWMAADIIYIPMYAYKGLWLTALLYVAYFALCVMGYLGWRADLRASEQQAPVLEAA